VSPSCKGTVFNPLPTAAFHTLRSSLNALLNALRFVTGNYSWVPSETNSHFHKGAHLLIDKADGLSTTSVGIHLFLLPRLN
jgi:hypothetical protein